MSRSFFSFAFWINWNPLCQSPQCCLSVALCIVHTFCVLRQRPLQSPLVKSKVCFETTSAEVLISLTKHFEMYSYRSPFKRWHSRGVWNETESDVHTEVLLFSMQLLLIHKCPVFILSWFTICNFCSKTGIYMIFFLVSWQFSTLFIMLVICQMGPSSCILTVYDLICP